jgi:uncharacterized protein YkwD
MQTVVRQSSGTNGRENNTKHHPIRTLLLFIPLLAGCALIIAGCIPACGSSRRARLYVVQPGDTLAKIAGANATTVGDLVELNEDEYPSLAHNPDAIEVGWELKLPSGGRNRKVVLPAGVRVSETPSPGSSTGSAPLDRDAFEAETIRLVDEERARAGLAPLEMDPGLMEFARWRSEDMVARHYFGHSDPETGEIISHRVRAAENVTKLLATTALNDRNARRAVANWMKSDGHRANILRAEAHRTGVGIAVGQNFIIVTQVFTR